MFRGPSTFFRNISWPINTCLSFSLPPQKPSTAIESKIAALTLISSRNQSHCDKYILNETNYKLFALSTNNNFCCSVVGLLI